VGHGDLQLRTEFHTSQCVYFKEEFETNKQILHEDMKGFFKLFQESTKDGSRAAALEMKKIAKRQTEDDQKFMLFHSLYFLVRSNSEMLSWPSSPLLVMLQILDPNTLSGEEPLEEGEERETPLHHLADLLDPNDYSTHVNQLILAKQLIEHGANVHAVSIPHAETPLHSACYAGAVTNLDFVELLLVEGADPNVPTKSGKTPLMSTITEAPGAARFLLNWPTMDFNATPRSCRSRETFLFIVRRLLTSLSDQSESPADLDQHYNQVQKHFLLQQWRGIEAMVVERGI
jgi:hypothetical protein